VLPRPWREDRSWNVQVISAPTVLLDDQLVDRGWVAVRDGRVVATGAGLPPAPIDVRLPAGTLAPGLVDLQCNGAFGRDLTTADAEGWVEVLAGLPAFGVTSVLPTLVTAPIERLVAALQTAASVAAPAGAARSLGVHLEGPYLSPQRAGAHRRDLLRMPDVAELGSMLQAGSGVLRCMTLAPELPGALAVVSHLVAAGIRVSVGHSDATDIEVAAAADAGATLVTHLYNAQSPLHHREPGVVGAALADERLTLGMIADLEHVAPTAVRVAFAAAGDRIALVSDATPALGLPPGRHVFAGDTVIVEAPGAPPRRLNGTLAGSALRLADAVGNVIGCGVSPIRALLAATRTPADAIGATGIGRLVPGSRADLVWFDEAWALRATWVDGHLVAGSTA
jgi:N-acetylglucosamine-6-phosphate deacetylase